VVIPWNTGAESNSQYSAPPRRCHERGEDTSQESDSLNSNDILAMDELSKDAFA
jgi:hypothetical protein